MKYKVIFLDIDGVLNGYNYFEYNVGKILKFLGLRHFHEKLFNPMGIHKTKIKRLAKIVEKTNARIVLSSSLRFSYFNKNYNDLSSNLKRLYDLFKSYNLEVYDITPKDFSGRRDIEILTWLAKHEDEIESYVILDDEPSLLKSLYDVRLVQTSTVVANDLIKGRPSEDTGLKNKHIKKAIAMLNIPISKFA